MKVGKAIASLALPAALVAGIYLYAKNDDVQEAVDNATDSVSTIFTGGTDTEGSNAPEAQDSPGFWAAILSALGVRDDDGDEGDPPQQKAERNEESQQNPRNDPPDEKPQETDNLNDPPAETENDDPDNERDGERTPDPEATPTTTNPKGTPDAETEEYVYRVGSTVDLDRVPPVGPAVPPPTPAKVVRYGDLPESTRNYLDDLNRFFFTPPATKGTPPPAPAPQERPEFKRKARSETTGRRRR